MIYPTLPKDLADSNLVNLKITYDLNERTQKPVKPIEVGCRINVGTDDPLDEYWKVTGKPGPNSVKLTEEAALALIADTVIPFIRETLGLPAPAAS